MTFTKFVLVCLRRFISSRASNRSQSSFSRFLGSKYSKYSMASCCFSSAHSGTRPNFPKYWIVHLHICFSKCVYAWRWMSRKSWTLLGNAPFCFYSRFSLPVFFLFCSSDLSVNQFSLGTFFFCCHLQSRCLHNGLPKCWCLHFNILFSCLFLFYF